MSDTRIETDSLGKVPVPTQALYGAQTARAVANFPISGRRMDRRFIAALGLIKCAAAAAMATETRMKKTLLSAIYERLPNDALAEHVTTCFRRMGMPPFGASDERVRKRMKAEGEFSRKIEKPRRTPGRGSSDQDSVSWLAPLSSLSVACSPKGTPSHHRDRTRLGKCSFAHKGMVHAGKVLALAALSLIEDRKALQRVCREFRRRTRDFTYDPLVPKRQLPPVRDVIPKTPPRP